ncbi:MAG: MotA/TolQ/ExbB proton channel family protein [Candidatus Latescibacteria bacterium]|nr:MotA/TolQ/ExbB proton channel family protein [Candidatus Latescibacterota bacterium]
MVQLFNDGGWAMYPIAFLLVFGVAIALERLYTLSQAAIDASGFFQQLEEALRNGGAKQAAELCSETRGPVASVIHAGLLRMHRGVDNVEKTIENAGAVQMAFLERGMVWLSTVANLAPMVGFLGTVSGMIGAFQAIKVAGDVEPSLVAGGISEALITTAAGLSVAIPTYIAFRYLESRIDRVALDMEAYSASLIDGLEAAPAEISEAVAAEAPEA